MVNAFLSCSLNDRDKYVISILASELQDKGIGVSQSSDFRNELSPRTIHQIKISNLVIGIVTGESREIGRILNEWKEAMKFNVPSILLVQNTVPIDFSEYKFPIITFSKSSPQQALDKLHDEMEKRKYDFYKDMNSVIWFFVATVVKNSIKILSRQYEDRREMKPQNAIGVT